MRLEELGRYETEKRIWYDLRNWIRQTPKPVKVELIPGQEFTEGDKTTLVMTLGEDDEFFRLTFENDWLLAQEEGFLSQTMSLAMQHKIDEYLADVDWYSYLCPDEDQSWPFGKNEFMTREEMFAAYDMKPIGKILSIEEDDEGLSINYTLNKDEE